ncbi:MAG: hypothetical protein WDA37_04350 [Dysgonamonadaceae bacterium]|jgi:hypothetical protein
MGIEKFIQKVCVQTAVYWGSPTNDGFGGFTFAEPIEIPVRWEDKTQIVATMDGQEVTSDTEVLVTIDLEYNGYLYLGLLEDLTDDEQENPMLVSGAKPIISISKIPMIKSTTEFVRKVYLRRKFYVS